MIEEITRCTIDEEIKLFAIPQGIEEGYEVLVEINLLDKDRNILKTILPKGVKQDYFEAVKWYRLSAEQGEASAQTNLGVMYSSGKGVLENIEEAKYWLARACENGNQAGCAKYQELNQE